MTPVAFAPLPASPSIEERRGQQTAPSPLARERCDASFHTLCGISLSRPFCATRAEIQSTSQRHVSPSLSGVRVPLWSTTQSYEIANPGGHAKQAASSGIFASIFPLFRSPVTLAVSQADSSRLSLHPKIPFPAAGLRRPIPFGKPVILGSLGAKSAPFRAWPVIIAPPYGAHNGPQGLAWCEVQKRSSAMFHSTISSGKLDFGSRLFALYLWLVV